MKQLIELIRAIIQLPTHNLSRIIPPDLAFLSILDCTRGRPPLTFRRYKFVSLHHPLRVPFLQWVNCTLTLRAASDVSRDRYPGEELSIDPEPAGLIIVSEHSWRDPPRGRKRCREQCTQKKND